MSERPAIGSPVKDLVLKRAVSPILAEIFMLEWPTRSYDHLVKERVQDRLEGIRVLRGTIRGREDYVEDG